MTGNKSSVGDPGKETHGYPGKELEAMSGASNYHRWILEIFKPYLGKHLVEVGAGIGSFSDLILKHHLCESLSLVEPSDSMYDRLAIHAQELNTNVQIDTYHGTFIEAAPLIKSRHLPDSILYVNVLEHIADDEGELKAVYQTLSERGRVFIFVPALTWLFGNFDSRLGHFRRYSKAELEGKLRKAGFKILQSSYFDFPGIGPWWVKYCLMKFDTMESGAVRFYDRFIVPTVRRIESVVTMPLGKNVIAIAEKS
ncbi:MAG TPA: methyltransferase domain-containing protein [Pyrinomonadaceae bacterium]|nr:methyltransferase domain-containing protein [Pyrinomonadaceae bacterium]